MTIETLMEKIRLPKEGQDCVQDFPMTETFYQSFKELFYEDSKAFFCGGRPPHRSGEAVSLLIYQDGCGSLSSLCGERNLREGVCGHLL